MFKIQAINKYSRAHFIIILEQVVQDPRAEIARATSELQNIESIWMRRHLGLKMTRKTDQNKGLRGRHEGRVSICDAAESRLDLRPNSSCEEGPMKGTVEGDPN